MTPNSNCIFCKIAAGQIPAKVVYEDPRVMAFRDVQPQSPVNILIIPKKHIESLLSVKPDDLSLVAEIHQVAKNIAQSEPLLKEGFRLVTNTGKNGGQSVSHLHTHLLGGRALAWPPG